MSGRHGRWIDRRGQAGAEAAIEQVLNTQPHPWEHVQLIADEQIEDSPYQARQPFDPAAVEELAQAMRAVGFQGVLIVRPHPETEQRRLGRFQLIYGHRRRLAWRGVCAEREEPCLLPVVTREVSDAQALLIGAQENMQRQDLDPVEEGQIVAWLERVFFDKNQAAIGALLGKSSDWVSTRARIHRLPDALKERLRQRPRAISQMLELGPLAAQQPDLALQLADRVVREQLSLDALRALIRGYARPERRETEVAPEERLSRGTAMSVPPMAPPSPSREILHDRRGAATDPKRLEHPDHAPAPPSVHPSADLPADGHPPRDTAHALALLQQSVATFAAIASRADLLQASVETQQTLEEAERALIALHRSLIRRRLRPQRPSQDAPYQLSGTTLDEVLAMLRLRHPVALTLRSAQTQGLSVRLLLCLLPSSSRSDRQAAPVPNLFVAVAEGSNASLPITDPVALGWVQRHLKLALNNAALVAALLTDLTTTARRLRGLGT